MANAINTIVKTVVEKNNAVMFRNYNDKRATTRRYKFIMSDSLISKSGFLVRCSDEQAKIAREKIMRSLKKELVSFKVDEIFFEYSDTLVIIVKL